MPRNDGQAIRKRQLPQPDNLNPKVTIAEGEPVFLCLNTFVNPNVNY